MKQKKNFTFYEMGGDVRNKNPLELLKFYEIRTLNSICNLSQNGFYLISMRNYSEFNP